MFLKSFAWWLAILAWLTPIPAGAAAEPQAAAPKSAPVASAPTAIPVGEIAARAAEVSSVLRSMTAQLAPSPEIQTILARLPEVSRQVGLELELMAEILRGQPALATIAAQQKVWEERQLQTTRWLNLLTARAAQFQEALNRLGDLGATPERKRWRRIAPPGSRVDQTWSPPTCRVMPRIRRNRGIACQAI